MADTAPETDFVRRPAYPEMPKPSKAPASRKPAGVGTMPRPGSGKAGGRPIDPMLIAQMLKVASKAGLK